MDILKNNGVHLSGTSEAVRKVADSHQVLEERKLGKELSIMLDTPMTADLKQQAEASGVMVEKVSFQDYLVNLTKKGGALK